MEELKKMAFFIGGHDRLDSENTNSEEEKRRINKNNQ